MSPLGYTGLNCDRCVYSYMALPALFYARLVCVATISETMKERLRAVEMWFLRRMLKISWTEKKSNLKVRRAAGVQRTLMMTIRQRQLDFFGHVMRRKGLEALVVTGKVEGRRARGRQRQKYLDSLCTCLEDNASPIQLIRATEDRLFWHDMVANVVNDDTAP